MVSVRVVPKADIFVEIGSEAKISSREPCTGKTYLKKTVDYTVKEMINGCSAKIRCTKGV